MELLRAHVRLRFGAPLLRIDRGQRELLDPHDYTRSRVYGSTLYRDGARGLRYPSVRSEGRGTCAGLFIPAVATEVAVVSEALPMRWDGTQIHFE